MALRLRIKSVSKASKFFFSHVGDFFFNYYRSRHFTLFELNGQISPFLWFFSLPRLFECTRHQTRAQRESSEFTPASHRPPVFPSLNVCFHWIPSWRETHLLTSAFCLLDPSRAVSQYRQEWHLEPDPSLLGGGSLCTAGAFSSTPGFCPLDPTVPPTPRCDSRKRSWGLCERDPPGTDLVLMKNRVKISITILISIISTLKSCDFNDIPTLPFRNVLLHHLQPLAGSHNSSALNSYLVFPAFYLETIWDL